jgi:DNA-binding Lrp family transcriptional regulator
MLSATEINIIRCLQEDLPLVPEPYKKLAEDLGLTESELLIKIREFKEKKIIRRFGATLNHRKVGFHSNAMAVWIVPTDRVAEVSKIMISFPQVSHCYERTTQPGWPYNLFTMIHGQSKQECEKVISLISDLTVIKSYNILYSSEELKKTSMKYFCES